MTLVGMALATIFTAWTPRSGTLTGWLAPAAGALSLPRETPVATAAPATAAPARELPLVGLVAGHKGNDSGAACPDGLTEAQVNLDIATRVKAGLEANGFRVDLLEEFDPRLDKYQALALISIHNDSCEYVNDLATGFKVAGALDGRAQNDSARLVACLTERYARATGMSFHANTVTRDMTQYHSFYEIADTTPAAIIETGFLNLDRKILTEEPQRVAQGVIDGVICFTRGEPTGSSAP